MSTTTREPIINPLVKPKKYSGTLSFIVLPARLELAYITVET
jgi:hypothetical protein